MKRIVTSIVFMISLHSFANQEDSLLMSRWIANARQQMNMDANVGKKYLDSLHAFLQSNSGFTFQEGEYYKFLAIYYFRKSNYDSALINYLIANRKYSSIGNTLEQAKVLVNTSMVYNRRGEYKETIEQASSALALFEELRDVKGIAISLNIIGQVHFANENFTDALKYFRAYVGNAMMAKDTVEIASGYANMGSAFLKLHELDSSLFYTRKAFKIQMAQGALYSIGNSLQNMGSNFREAQDYDSAIFYLKEAVKYYEQVDNTSGLAEVYLNLGTILSLTERHDQAIASFEKAMNLADATGELFLQKEILYCLSKSCEQAGRIPEAFQFFKRYSVISDSILNENNKEYIEELNARYETSKKEQQIALQQVQLDQQTASLKLNYLIMLALIVIVTLLIIIFILVRNRSKKEMELKVRETFIDASIQAQENERKRFAQDLHDGMGQMISSLRLLVGSINKEQELGARLEMVSRSEKILDEIQKEVRGIAFNLMPQTLIQSGIVSALQEMATRINTTDKLKITIQSFDFAHRQSEIVEISVYRVVQEWVNNVMKYSGGTRIDIQLVGHDNEVNITIEDNGPGFDPKVLEENKGHGWRNIKSRIKLMGGEVEVDSTAGRVGTILVLRVPLKVKVKDETQNSVGNENTVQHG